MPIGTEQVGKMSKEEKPHAVARLTVSVYLQSDGSIMSEETFRNFVGTEEVPKEHKQMLREVCIQHTQRRFIAGGREDEIGDERLVEPV